MKIIQPQQQRKSLDNNEGQKKNKITQEAFVSIGLAEVSKKTVHNSPAHVGMEDMIMMDFQITGMGSTTATLLLKELYLPPKLFTKINCRKANMVNRCL